MNIRDYKSRIVNAGQAEQLINDGYFALDPHCHSSYSYDVPDVKESDPRTIFKVQKSRRLMNVLTDHDTLNGYNFLKSKGLKAIPAVELTFRPKIARKILSDKEIHTLHINVFELSNHDLIMLREIAYRGDLDELVKYFKDNDLEYTYNHLFYHEKREHLNWRVIPGLAKNYFDVLELNSQFSRGLNNITQKIAEKLGKGIVASSDTHTGDPGTGYVVAEGRNFRDFWENVKDGRVYAMRRDMGTLDVIREASTMINHTFKSNIHSSKEKKYIPATGFGPFDDLAKSVTSGKLKNQLILKKIIYMSLQSLKFTAGPVLAWRLHVNKDEKKADFIRNRINLLTEKIRRMENTIKFGRKNNKNIFHSRINNHSNVDYKLNNKKHHSNIVQTKHYGEELVKRSKNRF